ncbi:TfpX/TfpZ family type IV pilin accessory protein [Pseudomonas sp. EL_65y_Pfl2_R95]|uniref:TfpX/TfpZ family type IV pilin accessory protein n=1 Tax=Pseudomonas sp. EL_65y_Pfl2_R95 TaxID=3088698 RepID=UPI0030DAEA3C
MLFFLKEFFMYLSKRYKPAIIFSLKHLCCSVSIALLSAYLVFYIWYPAPYDVLAGGRELFLLVISVDIVAGPLLSLVVYNPVKSKKELFCDIGIVVFLQVLALAYGLYSMSQARPVFLAYEGDRFQVVSVADIDLDAIAMAPAELKSLSFSGPKLIGVKLLGSTDKGYVESIQLAMAGQPPSFRPERWAEYQSQSSNVVRHARALSELISHYPESQAHIDEMVKKSGVALDQLGFYPVLSYKAVGWVIVVDLKWGRPVFFLDLDGWF